jgi:2-dehydropantoate 2-reductase
MKATVIGPGAVGGLIGALLARSGESVSFVARGKALSEIKERGIRIRASDEEFSTGPLPASDSPQALGVADLVVVAVKSWQVLEVAPTLKPLIGENTMVFPVQNGVEAADQLRAAVGDRPVLGGICHVISMLEAPGQIFYRGSLELTLGELNGGTSPRLWSITKVLQKAKMKVTLSENIRADLWEKLQFVEPLGSVGAVSRETIDVLRAIPETRRLLTEAMLEIAEVAKAVGVKLRDGAYERALKRVDALPAGATASMQRDVMANRRSELEEQTGAVIRIGTAAGVKVPVHEFLWAALLPQETRARKFR